MKSTAFTTLAFLALVSSGFAKTHTPGFTRFPKEDPVPDQLKSQGCYTSSGNLKSVTVPKDDKGQVPNVTRGNCRDACLLIKKPVMGLKGNECLCGDEYPLKEDYTKDEACDQECFGYPKEPCGNLGDNPAWSIYNTGIDMDITNLKPQKSTTSSAAPSKTSSSSKEEETGDPASNNPAVTSSGTSGDETKEEKKDGPNVAGIAAGVVVGVVAVAALVGGAFFFMRRRRNAEIEEEHRRNAAVNAFISGAKPPGSSGGMSINDSRLEPGLAHRRLSDGSIADNQDYSRKILRVTNA